MTLEKFEKGKLYHFSVIDFKKDPQQPRKTLDAAALDELTASIKEHGILEPVLFKEGDQGYVTIVAGERRIEAAKKAGLLTIPALYVDGNAAEIALVENMLRQDLTAVEEAEAMKRLMDEGNYNQEQLSNIIGKPRSTITDIIALTRLPQQIRDECRGDHKVSRAVLLEISRKKQDRAMRTEWNNYKEKLKKEQAGPQPRVVRAPTPEETVKLVKKTEAKLTSVDTQEWAADQKAAFSESLGGLKDRIENLMAALEENDDERPPGMSLS